MQIARIRLVVTDLDNTLYDWVTYFSTAFYRMVAVAAPQLNVDEDQLLDELRDVHRRHHNSEHPFALLETQAAVARFPGLSRAELVARLSSAFQEFNQARTEILKLYDGVLDTLESFRSAGTPVVGHTEATVPNALYRLKLLAVDEFFLRLYAVEPSGLGHPDEFRHNELLQTHIKVRYLKSDERKPDPRVLLDICRDMGVPPGEALYVGDSVARDIGMAKAAGVWAAWAKYGTVFDPSHWDRLVRITHWTDEDVRRAAEAKARFAHTQADVVLAKGFSELTEHFNFVSAV